MMGGLNMRWLLASLGAVLFLAGLWLLLGVYQAGHPLSAVGGLVVMAASAWVFLSPKAYAYRYLYPGVAAVLVFIVFPAVYTAGIGFTNYSSTNLLSFDRVTAYMLSETTSADGAGMGFSLHQSGEQYRLKLSDDAGQSWVSPLIKLQDNKPQQLQLQVIGIENLPEKESIKTVIAKQAALKALRVTLPNQSQLWRLSSLSQFSPTQLLYQKNADGSLRNTQDGSLIKPNFKTGFYETAAGERLTPGFKVNVGLSNFTRIFASDDFQGPMFKIFGWTVLFAFLTVVFTFVVGMALAVVLNWEALRFRGVYRTLLFLPYAVPGFISILVFRGLFNESFGEINMVLNGLFGLRPAWFSDPFNAKAMILIVNTWLGYPYIMLLCSGLIKSIPSDLYEASAINGAGPLTNLFKITLPLILKPMMPLLIASFAFNFNNFVLISLLTDGRPDFIDSKVPAGTTDILVSYTYRLAFQDSGQNFGLAAAISTVIFALVAVLSLINLKLTRVNQEEKR
ncbi:maltose ABC transporter permease MalF [Iodobacter sp. CM08]|uniref:maltose ABC transporter permease MalF n=1 Tax=Iodobacter sp. CM08 TaxID=3085902 RepID=UPI002981796E|nr:maltose ABC transporter permease MalF [Iodobacter sp. CM08]MDW5418774.1 maltose ABC transporter permease MalF [Iodobacter sp. CM08]